MERIVFASDFHLGINGAVTSEEREKLLVRWIEEVAMSASEVFLLGDIFDFWFEYKKAIPKGFVRFQGALAALTDSGVPVHLFIGNHDMWIFDYFREEFNINLYRKPHIFERQGRKLLIGHGDGLGPGDHTFKVIRRVFHSPAMIGLFRWVHPDFGIRVAHAWSNSSRAGHGDIYQYHGPSGEYLLSYCEEQSALSPDIDYFVFGHRHLVFDYLLSNGHSRYINIGDWLQFNSYAVLEQGDIHLRSYDNTPLRIITNETTF